MLVVRADWRNPLLMKAQGWHRGWFNFGGLNREVTIRPLGTTEIVDPEVTTTLRDDGSPHTTVVWVDVDTDVVMFNTAVGRAKKRHLRKDPLYRPFCV